MKNRLLFILLILPFVSWAQNKKISEMDSVTAPAPRLYFPIVDPSEPVAADRNKKISVYRFDERYVTDQELLSSSANWNTAFGWGSHATAGYLPQMIPSIGADHSSNGRQTNSINAGATIAAMQLVFMGTSGKWELTDADAEASAKGLLAISLEAKNNTEAILVAWPGQWVRDDSWTWTPGDILYVSQTSGAITNTAPTGTDVVVRIVGYAINATTIEFNPSPDYITLN